ncbi:hypothetical protein GGR52DRAFT_370044 [Hypoxylon sp. FL1284]|nr:hypothetical protein GGR52DRAFT_370044 [Hypoxylon sp. FL1284]
MPIFPPSSSSPPHSLLTTCVCVHPFLVTADQLTVSTAGFLCLRNGDRRRLGLAEMSSMSSTRIPQYDRRAAGPAVRVWRRIPPCDGVASVRDGLLTVPPLAVFRKRFFTCKRKKSQNNGFFVLLFLLEGGFEPWPCHSLAEFGNGYIGKFTHITTEPLSHKRLQESRDYITYIHIKVYSNGPYIQ